MYSFSGNCAASVPISILMCLWGIYIFPGLVHIFPGSRIDRPILEIYTVNLSQMFECRNWETATEHYNYVLEITVSFMGIHKWEPYIYIGFSPALHLQCITAKVSSYIYETSRNWMYSKFTYRHIVQPQVRAHSPAGEGLGESQFRRQEKKLSTLPTLCVQHTTYLLYRRNVKKIM